MTEFAPDWVAYFARRDGASLALENIDTGTRLGWRQLEARVAAVAGMLASRYAVARGDRVAVIAENDFRVFELQFACMRLGAILVPLNWRLAVSEVSALLEDAAPRLLVHDAAWADTAAAAASAAAVPQVLGWDASGGRYEHELALARPVGERHDNGFDDATHILYTSGTTGRPKGVLVTNRTLLAQVQNTLVDCALGGPGSKYLNPMPLFHAGGLTTLSAPILATGGAVAFSARFDPARFRDWLSDPARQVTHFNGSPIFFDQIAAGDGFESLNFGHLRHAHVAGTTIRDELVERWHSVGLTVQQFYGGTEMGPSATAMPTHRVRRKTRSCGLPLKLTRARVVDQELRDVRQGDEGEILLSGPSITPGYWRRERTPDAFVGQWFRTGDVGRCDEEGYFYVVDRIKDMYKSGGENVFPAEIEQALMEMPSIAEVAIVGVPDDRWGEVGKAVVVAAAGAHVTLESVTAHLNGRFARYKMPKSVSLAASLPRNALGKVDKKALRAAS